jgi:hypothetical protein
LDFSKVNKKVKTRTKITRKKNGKRGLSFEGNGNMDGHPEDGVDSSADLCILSEEVVESVWAGRNHKPNPRHSISIEEIPVTVVLNIEKRSNWGFDIDAGGECRPYLSAEDINWPTSSPMAISE